MTLRTFESFSSSCGMPKSGSAVGIRLSESALPPGPMRDLVDALRELYRAAGMLSTRVISEMIRGRDDLPDTVSHETVGLMLRGTRLVGWTKFECVVRLLAERSVNPVFDPLSSVRRFHDLWLDAKDAIAPGSRFVGMFRAHGLLAPVWDLPVGTGPEPLEEPAELHARIVERLTAVVGEGR